MKYNNNIQYKISSIPLFETCLVGWVIWVGLENQLQKTFVLNNCTFIFVTFAHGNFQNTCNVISITVTFISTEA